MAFKKTDTNLKKLNDDTKGQKSTAGVYSVAGDVIQSDYDDTDIQLLIKDYTLMRNEDAIASSSINLITNTISNSKFSIRPGYVDEEKPTDMAIETANYVEWVYNNLYPTLSDYLYHKNLAFPFGFIIFEKVYKRGVKYVDTNGVEHITNVISRLAPIQHDTIHDFLYNDKGYFVGIKQLRRNPNGGTKIITLNLDELYVFTPFSEFNNVTGRGLLRPSRKAWTYKNSVWKASTRSASRGAGIPTFTIGSQVSATDRKTYLNTAKIMGKTMGNSENAFMVEEEDRFTFRLESLTNQQDNMDLINLANSEMWYNTLTHTVMSGIGQNGSRSATEEHKSPLVESINYMIRLLDYSENSLIQDIIECSYLYGSIDKREYPYAVRERLKDKDASQLTENLLRLATANAITLGEKDEKYVRELLGLPELSNEEMEQNDAIEKAEEAGQPVELPEDTELSIEVKPEDVHICSDECNHTLSKESTNLIDDIANAEIVYLEPIPEAIVANILKSKPLMDSIADASKEVLNTTYSRLVENIAGQLQKRPNEAPKFRYKTELINELSSLFDAGFIKGRSDVKKEFAEIGGIELAKDNLKITGLGDRLNIKVDFLYESLDTAIKETLTTTTPQVIENAGGMKKFIIDRFGDGNKKIKSGIASLIEGGYVAGRSEEIKNVNKKNSPDEVVYQYTTMLEGNVCSVCAPLESARFTESQAIQAGLNFNPPVNPQCLGGLGGNTCRCILVPVARRKNIDEV